MEIIIKSDNVENESISDFAYTMGKSIEQILNEKTNNLEERSKLTEAKILNFRQILDQKQLEVLKSIVNPNMSIEELYQIIEDFEFDNEPITITIREYNEHFGIKKLPGGKI